MKKFKGFILLSIMMLVLSACNMNNDATRDNRNDDDLLETENTRNNGRNVNMLATSINDSSDTIPHNKKNYQWQITLHKFGFGSLPQQPNISIRQRQQTTQQQTQQPNNQGGQAPQTQQPQQQPQQPQQQQTEKQAPTTPEAGATKQPQVSDTTITQLERAVVDLTNAQRQRNGLKPLTMDPHLSSVARKKSLDMANNNYFSHNSPTYGSPFDMMRDFGVQYKTAGENIARGQTTAEQVVDGWMNSEGHRRNILNANYTHIGVGHSTKGNYWTQMFIGK